MRLDTAQNIADMLDIYIKESNVCLRHLSMSHTCGDTLYFVTLNSEGSIHVDVIKKYPGSTELKVFKSVDEFRATFCPKE